jgi:hypothetical protein
VLGKLLNGGSGLCEEPQMTGTYYRQLHYGFNRAVTILKWHLHEPNLTDNWQLDSVKETPMGSRTKCPVCNKILHSQMYYLHNAAGATFVSGFSCAYHGSLATTKSREEALQISDLVESFRAARSFAKKLGIKVDQVKEHTVPELVAAVHEALLRDEYQYLSIKCAKILGPNRVQTDGPPRIRAKAEYNLQEMSITLNYSQYAILWPFVTVDGKLIKYPLALQTILDKHAQEYQAARSNQ